MTDPGMPPDLARAWEELGQAEATVERDPQDAAAWERIAVLLSSPPIVYSGANRLRAAEAYPRAGRAAHRAIELDPVRPAPHTVLATIAWYGEWDYAEAERRFRAAIECGDAAAAHGGLARLLAQQGRFDEAWMILEPFAPDDDRLRIHRGAVAYLERRFDLALEAWNPLPFWSAMALCELGRPAEAADRQLVGMEPDRNPGYVAGLARALVLAGRHAEADGLIAELHEREGRGERIVDYQMSAVAVARGEHSLALDLLERSLPHKGNWLCWLPRDPRFDALRGDPRFEAVVRAVGL